MIEALTAGVYWSTPLRIGLYVIVRAGSYREITSAEAEAEAMRQARQRGWKPEDPEPSDPSGPIVGRWYRVFWFYATADGSEPVLPAPVSPLQTRLPILEAVDDR